MQCPICGQWGPPDRETGYDADEPCSVACGRAMEDIMDNAERQDVIELTLQNITDALETFKAELAHADAPRALWLSGVIGDHGVEMLRVSGIGHARAAAVMAAQTGGARESQ